LYPTVPDEERDLTLQMATGEGPESPLQSDAQRAEFIEDKLGLAFSDTGIVNDADVTIHFVLPGSPAARAGLQAGDKVVSIAGEPPYTPEDARAMVDRHFQPESSLVFAVRRGLDHPFTAHPRLDLFLSDTSPHPLKDVGCTVCHDGQGSGTSFPWTSHTPDNA
jgi:membrane-associated protease RseP (regulator of RpoE activity)